MYVSGICEKMRLRRSDKAFLYDPLLEVLGSVEYILYPMRHENEFHFTLVVLQKSKEEWLHYNSKREGKEAFKDPCYIEAKKLVSNSLINM